MNTPTHNILIAINVTAEQLAATDALYEIIGPELKKDEELKYKFNTFFNSKLSGVELIDAFAKVMQPAIARLAVSLGETLSLPLYMSLAKHITAEWVQEPALLLAKKAVENTVKVRDAYLDGIDAKREAGMSTAFEAPYGINDLKVGDVTFPNVQITKNQTLDETSYLLSTDANAEHLKKSISQLDTAQTRELIRDIDPEALRPALPTPTGPLARGSAGQDRSRPVLSARVLRGFDKLVDKLQLTETGRSEAVPGLTKGDKEAQAALKYIERMVAWGKKNDRV